METKKEYTIKAMIFFPEVFSKRNDKFNRLALWLINSQSIINPNTRDMFSSGGQGTITWKKNTYTKIPKIILKLTDYLPGIITTIHTIDNESLIYYWGNAPENRFEYWADLVTENADNLKLPFDLKEYLYEA